MSSTRSYGWRRQLPDFRDFKYRMPCHLEGALPTSVDLRSIMPPVYDQTTLGSCTSQSIAGGHQVEQIKQCLPANGSNDPAVISGAVAGSFVPSRLFIYWNERYLEGGLPQTMQDSGAEIRDGIKCVVSQGVCDEKLWPYDVNKYTVKPTDNCYTVAMDYQVTSYQAIAQNLDQLKGCLAEGYPFEFGFSVYDSFESDAVAQTGIVPMPDPSESQLGGHAVLAVGYDDAKQWFIVRNSWGPGWGDKGYFYMPYAYLANAGLASDFWTIRLVEMNTPEPTPPGPAPTPTPPAPPPAPTPTPTPTPSPSPCDCSLAFPIAKQFLDAAAAELNRGGTTESAMAEGFRASQEYVARVAEIRARQGR